MDDELNALKHGVEVSRLMADMLERHERENKRLWLALVACIICIAIMAVCAVWAVNNAQAITDEAMLKALNAVGDVTATTTTTTQSAEGDSVTFNNVDGEQYNDSAQKAGAD